VINTATCFHSVVFIQRKRIGNAVNAFLRTKTDALRTGVQLKSIYKLLLWVSVCP